MNAISGRPVAELSVEFRNRSSRYRAKVGFPNQRREDDAISRLEPLFLPVGDTGISVQFGTEIDPVLNDAVTSLDHAIAAADLPGVIETVPSFRSLLVVFEPASVERDVLLAQLRTLASSASRSRSRARRRWSLPVAYGSFGEDLAELAGLLGRSEEAIVGAHLGAEFRVYMLGFQPGLPNLGGLPPDLHISRRTSPRKPVPGGSVMIGGVQGAIMPLPTPTGLYMVGRTPVRLFDRRRAEPALLKAGDLIRFRAICSNEFTSIGEAVAAGDLDAGATLQEAA